MASDVFAGIGFGSLQVGAVLARWCIDEHLGDVFQKLECAIELRLILPLSLNDLARMGCRRAIAAEQLENAINGQKVRVAGLVLVRQRPGTASGVIFMTLQDETHIANIVVWQRVFEHFRPEVLGARLCAVDGVVQNVNARFARVENVRKFVILRKQLDHDDGEVTATMKVRRAAIEKKFGAEIAEIYGPAEVA